MRYAYLKASKSTRVYQLCKFSFCDLLGSLIELFGEIRKLLKNSLAGLEALRKSLSGLWHLVMSDSLRLGL